MKLELLEQEGQARARVPAGGKGVNPTCNISTHDRG